VAVQNDGKLIVGGNFNTIDGIWRGYFARLLTNGALDMTFGAAVTGANARVRAVALQRDGKVVIGGEFTRVNGQLRDRFARIEGGANVTLSALSISEGTLIPVFSASILSYTAAVPNATASVTVTPTSEDANATNDVRVNGGSYSTVAYGTPSDALTLNVGTNTIEIRVTGVDGTTKTYTLIVPVAQSAQTIVFDPIADQVTTNQLGLSATASSALPVTFAVGNGPASITGGTNLSFTGTGSVSIVASQGGNSYYLPAPDVTNTFVVFAFADENENLIPDEWEWENFGSLDAVTETSDADDDGMFDWQEYVAGTNPTNVGSKLLLEAAPLAGSDHSIVVKWSSASNRYYAIGRKTNLLDAFLYFTSGLPSVPPMNVHTDAPPGGGTWFYRINVQAEP
jgi:hypothetical protein